MKTELLYLVWTTVLTGLLWIPYIVDRGRVRGVQDAMGYPENPKPQAPWAQRLQKAHYNAVENLVLFATLVLTAHAIGLSTPAIGTAAAVYFWARVVHAAVYTFGVPWVRTISWTVGWLALAVIAWQILAA
ncbi:MAG: MAPEG family protein [Burkholderiales bacterium]|nr:MAPEG family protein [Burkholderiales bacterium]